jgi:dTDP-4-dehydrorhamnose 3,5-epimerase
MKFQATPLRDVWVIQPEFRRDERGFFARVFCSEEFSTRKLETNFVQINNSQSLQAYTLRGLHYQIAPAGEAKLVRCIRGRAFDVVVDLRENSPTFMKWYGAELTADNRLMTYVPKGFAHGFMTLEPETEMLYLASAPYNAASERALRWNDPAVGISWPRLPSVLSDRDRVAPDFSVTTQLSGY